MPESIDNFYIESWNREIDCYMMQEFYTNRPLIISRDYLMNLLDKGVSKILI